MEKNNKVVKAGIWYTIGNYMIKGLVFFTIPIFSRLLSTADYGTYSTFTSYEGILFVIIGLAFNSSYRSAWYRYGQYLERRNYYSYVSTTMLIIICSTLFWITITTLFGKNIGNILGLDSISVFLLILYSAAMAILACFNAHIGLQYDYKKFIKISFCNAISNILFSILLICTFFSKKRYIGRMVGTTVPAVLVAIYIIYMFFKKAKPEMCKEYLSWGLKYSIPIIPYGIGLVLLGTFDRIMINKMVGAEAVGIYSFAYNIFALVNVTSNSLDNVWSPWLFEQMNNKKYDIVKKQAIKYIFLMLIFSSIVILVGPEIVKLIGAKEYWNASYCVIPIVAGGYFSFLCTLPISVEYFYEKTKFIATGTIIAGIVNIILNYIFIKKYGYIAAAYTTLITYMIYSILHYIIARYIHKKSLFDNRVTIGCAVLVLFITWYSNKFINSIALRWSLGIILGGIFIFIEEREFGIGKKLIRRRK